MKRQRKQNFQRFSSMLYISVRKDHDRALMFRMIISALVSLSLISCVAAGGRSCRERQSEPWSYGGKNGPKKWAKSYVECGGQAQSPIDVVQSHTIKTWGEYPRFYGYKVPLIGKVKNNGNTIDITPTDGVKRAVVIEGTDFTLREIHFHFGTSKKSGSEHVRDGRRVAMEMHLVHNSTDGRTAVFAVLFKETSYNADVQDLVEAISHIKYQGDETAISKGIKLYGCLPHCKTTFYRYEGSLTTPPCTEGVIWTVFKYPNMISGGQMEAFLQQRSTSESTPEKHECFMKDNIRPLQRLNGRKIKIYNPECEVVYT